MTLNLIQYAFFCVNKTCKHDELATPKLGGVAKGILEDTIKVTNQLTMWQQLGDFWDITEVGPSKHIHHLKAVFSVWQHKGKSRNSKHKKDSWCHF